MPSVLENSGTSCHVMIALSPLSVTVTLPPELGLRSNQAGEMRGASFKNSVRSASQQSSPESPPIQMKPLLETVMLV